MWCSANVYPYNPRNNTREHHSTVAHEGGVPGLLARLRTRPVRAGRAEGRTSPMCSRCYITTRAVGRDWKRS